MTKIIGLTGGIGSGKTRVAKYIESLGVPVYITDDEAKKINIEKIKTNGIEHYTSYIKQALLHGCLFV